MLISVVIPTYNHGDFILATLDSVFRQTLKNFEIIIVNDGSPDHTAAVLSPLVETGKIRYIEQSNAGQAAARNRGLQAATGEFVAFLDDDDLWPSDKLEWQVDFLRTSPEVNLVSGTVATIDADGTLMRQHGCKLGQISFDDLFFGSPIWSPGQTLIRRGALLELGGFCESIRGADDYDLWMRLAKSSPLMTCNRPSLLYRVHGGNASQDSHLMLCNTDLVIRKHLDSLDAVRRSYYRKAAYRWMFSRLGVCVIEDMAIALQHNQIKSAIKNFLGLRLFLFEFMRDPRLLGFIARTMLNRSINNPGSPRCA